jgi:CBS domain containing-hemolysin-like protein
VEIVERSMTTDLVWIAAAFGLVAINGFFVAAEFALVKVRPARLAELERQGRPFAKSALWLSSHLDRSLSACQLGITMASLGLGWIGEPAVAHLVEPMFSSLGVTSPSALHGFSFAIAFTLITAAHLVLGEQAPKIFAIKRPEVLALACAAPMRAFYVATYPLLRGLDGATKLTLHMVGVDRGLDEEAPHSEEELRILLGHSRAHGELSSWKHRLVEAVFEFDDILCRQIMVPRTDVVLLNVRTPFEKTLEIARRTKHTRYPVCDGDLDDVLGVLHLKDLLGFGAGDEVDLKTIMRPPKYVPETMPISKLMGHFQATRQHMAIVVDEFGVSVGVVTLENVLERIVGPVQDEFDSETPDIVRLGAGEMRVRGILPIATLSDLIGAPVKARGVDTVGGLIALRLGRIPAQGDRLEIGDATLEVEDVRHNRAGWVKVLIRRADGQAPAAAGFDQEGTDGSGYE